jgi:hypothetical protein
MKATKYIVIDEDGPLRVFHTIEEANNFLQPGWTIKVIEYKVKVFSLDDFEPAPF